MEEAVIIISICSLIVSIICIFITIKTKKRYENYVNKLGNGENLAESMKEYIRSVDVLNQKDKQILEYCNSINKEFSKCIKKVGFISYDAYNDTSNKLSFVLALLDNSNDGIIINSIYGIDSSNIYAKLVKNGESNYKLSSEEKEAIKIAKDK